MVVTNCRFFDARGVSQHSLSQKQDAKWDAVGPPKTAWILSTYFTSPEIKARFAELSATALEGTPADFGKFIADEIEKWAKVVKFSDAKPD